MSIRKWKIDADPYFISRKTSFALIDNDDYKELSREFKNNGPFSIDDYRKRLFMMASSKDREIVEVTILNDNQSCSKSIVAIYMIILTSSTMKATRSDYLQIL